MKTSVESTVRQSYIKCGFIIIPKDDWGSFPPITTPLELKTDIVPIKTKYYVRIGQSRGFSTRLRPWYEAHLELKVGDKLIIEVRGSKSGKEYRLLSPKEQKEVI